jgi:hypothetical protein
VKRLLLAIPYYTILDTTSDPPGGGCCGTGRRDFGPR